MPPDLQTSTLSYTISGRFGKCQPPSLVVPNPDDESCHRKKGKPVLPSGSRNMYNPYPDAESPRSEFTMIKAYFPYLVVLICSAAISAYLLVRTWPLRHAPAGRPFLGLMLCTFFYSLGYAFELASGDRAGMLFWNKIQYLGISFIPVFWLLLASRYSGRDSWLIKPIEAVLFLLSVLTFLFNITNDLHHLFYTGISLDADGSYPALVLRGGPWYWVHIAYSNLALLTGNAILIGSFRHSRTPYRRQAAIMVAGSVVPWLALFIYLLGISPNHLDTTPLGLMITGVILAWGLFRFKIFDLAPVAKESVFASIKDGAVVLDPQDRIVDFNPAARRALPELSSRVAGLAFKDAVQSRPELHRLFEPGGREETDLRIPEGDTARFYHAVLSPILNRHKRTVGRILLLSDTTDHMHLVAKLHELATIDDLTGAFIRRHFLELGRREMVRAHRYGRPISLLIIDIDHFKTINDTWGHEAGDAVLRAICRAFRAALRSVDLLCRHGGEEFAVLLPETPPEQARAVADRLRTTVGENPVKISGGQDVRITVSIGISGWDKTGEDKIEDLLRKADQAMYQAKAAGRNGIQLLKAEN